MNKKELLSRVARNAGFGFAFVGLAVVYAAGLGVVCVRAVRCFVDSSIDVAILLSK